MVFDSAGIRIVIHGPAHDRFLEPEPEPLLTLGEDEADPLFRVVGALLEADGGVTVANAGTREIRRYAPDGSLLETLGGEGDGPGEFRSLSGLQRLSDGGRAANDAAARRITIWDPNGEFRQVRDADLGVDDGAEEADVIIPSGILMWIAPDGHVLGTPGMVIRLRGQEGVLPVTGPLRLYAPGLAEHRELDRFRLHAVYETPGGEGMPVASIDGVAFVRFSSSRDRLALTSGDRHLVRVFDGAEEVMRIREERTRRPHRPDSVVGEAPPADSLPAYSELQVDADGRVWAGAPTAEGDASTEWRLFGHDGLYRATLRLPPRAQVLDARGERVLVLLRDELDVESARLLRVAGLEGAAAGGSP